MPRPLRILRPRRRQAIFGMKGRTMSYKVGVPDQEARIRGNQASRDEDAARLASGEIDRKGLEAKNGFFTQLPIADLRIVSVGGGPLARAR